jgi:hypothetical protein
MSTFQEHGQDLIAINYVKAKKNSIYAASLLTGI